MIKILFICHGNICRSPMAEYVMTSLIAQRGLEQQIYCESAATSTEELGNDVYPPARRVMRAHGIDCPRRAARQVRAKDAQAFDLLVGMDSENIRNMQRIFGPADQSKIHRLMEFADQHSCDVADPWYSGDFETCYSDILAGCKGLLRYLGHEER